MKQQHQLLQNILTKAAAALLHKTNNIAGKCHVSQDKRKEMDHEARVASQRSDRKTLYPLAQVLAVRLQQLEPLLGINKQRLLTAKSKS